MGGLVLSKSDTESRLDQIDQRDGNEHKFWGAHVNLRMLWLRQIVRQLAQMITNNTLEKRNDC